MWGWGNFGHIFDIVWFFTLLIIHLRHKLQCFFNDFHEFDIKTKVTNFALKSLCIALNWFLTWHNWASHCSFWFFETHICSFLIHLLFDVNGICEAIWRALERNVQYCTGFTTCFERPYWSHIDHKLLALRISDVSLFHKRWFLLHLCSEIDDSENGVAKQVAFPPKKCQGCVLFPQPQQQFEILRSNMLTLASTCDKNEGGSAGKSWHTTTASRDSKLGPQVDKQLIGEFRWWWLGRNQNRTMFSFARDIRQKRPPELLGKPKRGKCSLKLMILKSQYFARYNAF